MKKTVKEVSDMADLRCVAGREVFWDMTLADKVKNVRLEQHHPVRKNAVLVCDAPWEGEHCGYGSLLCDGEKYRLYYRGCGFNGGVWNLAGGEHTVWCVAYSVDGKTFTKPSLGLYEFNGSFDNNIVLKEDRYLDNFSVMKDDNPACASDARYKAFSQFSQDGRAGRLAYYKSADGLHFEFERLLDVEGTFDSLNLLLWDAKIGKYRLYFRGFHDLEETEEKIEFENEGHVRDVRLALSEDLIHWSAPQRLLYGDNYAFQFYTNGIMKYPRADVFLGIPTRYVDRSPDRKNYAYLPDVNGFRPMLIEKFGRGGTAMTEATLMISRDGLRFDRTLEAFLTPGIENGDNWVYGDGYFEWGLAETASDVPGEPAEYSLYTHAGYRARPVSFLRYTMRLDGFFSWSADYAGGEVLTKPFVCGGSDMRVNFETSALGSLRLMICDENGAELEGYDSGRLFGNAISRPVDFDKPLALLKGKAVRLKITLRDAKLYAMELA